MDNINQFQFQAELEYILGNFDMTPQQANQMALENVISGNLLHQQDNDADSDNEPPSEEDDDDDEIIQTPAAAQSRERASGIGKQSIYCVKCKTKTPTNNLTKVSNDVKGTKRWFLKGTCAKCGTKKSQTTSGPNAGMMPKRPPGSPPRAKKAPPKMQGKIPVPNFNFGPNPNPPMQMPPKIVKQQKYATPNVKGKLQPKNLFG